MSVGCAGSCGKENSGRANDRPALIVMDDDDMELPSLASGRVEQLRRAAYTIRLGADEEQLV